MATYEPLLAARDIYHRTGLTIDSTGVIYDLNSIIGPGSRAKRIVMRNRSTTIPVFFELDRPLASVVTTGADASRICAPGEARTIACYVRQAAFRCDGATTALFDVEFLG